MADFKTQTDAELQKAYNDGLAKQNVESYEAISNDTDTERGYNSENNIVHGNSIIDDANRIILNDTTDNKISGEQKDLTQEEVNLINNILKAPLNPTDPIVWHDPTFVKGIIIKPLSNSIGENAIGPAQDPQLSHKVDGIFIPLVQINDNLIGAEDVIRLKLTSTDIFPELELTIADPLNKLASVSSPGINNKVMLMIMPPVDGVYKKIQLPFYITDIMTSGNNKTLFCKFKLLTVEQRQIGEMNYPHDNEWPGCDRCKQPAAKLANTWETLHYIAKETGLGFASTQQCKEINDRQIRRFNGSYLNSIASVLETSGKDDSNVFDAWVDLYGYITMVNMPWVLENTDVEANNLAIYSLVGYKTTEENGLLPDPKPELVNRTITNAKFIKAAPTNLRYDTYKINVENDAYELGTLTTYKYLVPRGAGGNNNVVEFQIQIEENSKQGTHTEEYETKNIIFLGTDCSGKNLLKQKVLNKSYKLSHRMKIMELHLPEANFGLQRGTLVNLTVMESDAHLKYHIIYSTKNIYSNEPDTKQESLFNMTDENGKALTPNEIITNGDIELPNTALSGMYYIDGMEFTYSYQNQKIEQILYLIKKGTWNSFVGPDTLMAINEND